MTYFELMEKCKDIDYDACVNENCSFKKECEEFYNEIGEIPQTMYTLLSETIEV